MTFDLDGWQALSTALGTVLPIIVALVTRADAPAAVKSWLLAGLSAVSGFGSQLLAAHDAAVAYNVATGLLTAVTTFVVGVGVHYGLWKPTGITARAAELGVRSS